MVKRLLSALEYPQCDTITTNDEPTFRRVIIWLEQNKIKKCTPALFSSLKNIAATDWSNNFVKYREELGCPNLHNNQEYLQWFVGHAVQTQNKDKRDLYRQYAVENLTSGSDVPNVVTENPLDKLNFRSKEFADGISGVAKILKIVPHPDPLVTLKAVCTVVTTRLSPQALEKPQDVIVKGTPFPFQDADLGFDLNDNTLNQAAKVLRMLYIHDLRDLQTRANELIVAVQGVTANPKTDTKLGKVGMK